MLHKESREGREMNCFSEVLPEGLAAVRWQRAYADARQYRLLGFKHFTCLCTSRRT